MNYRRLRHTYGFGVHSPFAYRMVKDVVRPARCYVWYGYEDIEAVANFSSSPHSLERQAKMFHRLVAFLNPASLFLPKGIDPLFHAAASNVDSRMRIERNPQGTCKCELLASHGDFLPLETLLQHIEQEHNSLAIFDLPEGWLEQIESHLPNGLILYGKRNAIIVNRPQMRKVKYSVRI